MEWLVWIGAAVTLAGLAGLIASVVMVRRARRSAAGDDAALRAALARVIPVNLGALLLSALGLTMVVVGLLLGG